MDFDISAKLVVLDHNCPELDFNKNWRFKKGLMDGFYLTVYTICRDSTALMQVFLIHLFNKD